MPKALTRNELEHFGSLITIKGRNQCLGDLLYFAGHGTFDPTYGKVPVPVDEVKLHNDALDKALVEGLDRNCKVGQGGFFYYHGGKVVSFAGLVVSTDIAISGKAITFRRDGKTFRGRLNKDADAFNFKRIA